jgi:HlyD family secretion protein
MDIQKSNNKKLQTKHIVTLILCGSLIAYLALRDSQGVQSIDKETIIESRAQIESFNIDVEATGKLVSKSSGAVISNTGGVITKRYISNGDAVKKGELLYELANPELAAQYSETINEFYANKSKMELERLDLIKEFERNKANLIRSKLELKNKNAELKAKKALYELNNPTISKLEYEKVLMEYELSKNSYESEKNLFNAFNRSKDAKIEELKYSEKTYDDRLNRITKSIADLKVLAPNDGVVQDSTLDEGDAIDALSLLCRIPNNNELYISAQISSYEIDKIKSGQKVKIFINQDSYNGTVNRIDPLVKDSKVNIDIKPNNYIDGQKHKINTQVRVVVTTETKSSALTVSRPVNVRENSEAYIYVVEGNNAKRREVKFGVGSLTKIEVISGLAPDEIIIISEIPETNKSSESIKLR